MAVKDARSAHAYHRANPQGKRMKLLYASDFKIKLEHFDLTRSENIRPSEHLQADPVRNRRDEGAAGS
jgi:hypothetical protein